LTIFGAKNDREITSVTPSILSPQYQPDGQLSSVKAAEMINTAIKNGSHFFEWTHQKINGDKFPANVRLVKIELEGKLYLQATVRDITAQKKAEEKINQEKDRAEQLNDELLKATTKSREMAALAEKANNSKSEFLANMSHEIRTPMNAIIGFSDILAEENLSSNQLENVNIIKDSANNLLRIINDILDFSKIEAGRLDVESVDCSLGRLLNSVYSMMKNKADKKGLEFEVVVDDDVPETVKTDPARLQQCLVNLINNAVKFTEKGHIIVKVSKNSIDGKCFISFAVEDTGIGIAEEKQDIIFESFTQEDGTISRKFGGTGLGLAITKRLANLLGGNLELESEQGKGSVFTLTAAADEIAGNLKSVGSESVIESSSNKEHQNSEDDKLRDNFDGRILVAEDVKTNQVLIKSLLKRLGLECVIAEDGKEAVEKAQSESFDLILMDIHMPNMDGYDATQALREKGNKTAIIALTAKAMKDDRQKCIDAGCNDYMTKPIKRQELIKILNQYIPRLSREKPIQV
jgi:signal transduction histidine kinase/ActR/RegA family two-component response regulator